MFVVAVAAEVAAKVVVKMMAQVVPQASLQGVMLLGMQFRLLGSLPDLMLLPSAGRPWEQARQLPVGEVTKRGLPWRAALQRRGWSKLCKRT